MGDKVSLLFGGVQLMVVGMVAVYVFLILMIFLMNLLAKLLAPLAKKGFMEPAPAAPKKPAAKKSVGNDAALAAAAVAAVKAHTK